MAFPSEPFTYITKLFQFFFQYASELRTFSFFALLLSLTRKNEKKQRKWKNIIWQFSLVITAFYSQLPTTYPRLCWRRKLIIQFLGDSNCKPVYLKVISVTQEKGKGEPNDTITQEQFNIRANGRSGAVTDRQNSGAMESTDASRASDLRLN